MRKLIEVIREAAIPLRVAAVIALVYLGYTFLSRRIDTQRWMESHQQAEAAANPKFEATYYGKELKIIQFYARDASIVEGTGTVLCYGLVNAKSVKIEPPVEGVAVSLNRCVEAAPTHTTRYTLTAEGNDNSTATASAEVQVTPDVANAPKINSFGVAKDVVENGRHIYTVTFAFQNARRVSIDPPVFGPIEDSAPFGQFFASPETATTYTLTVTNDKGKSAQKKLTLDPKR